MGGLIAVIRQNERSWLVWLTLLPGVLVLFLLLGEILFRHEKRLFINSHSIIVADRNQRPKEYG